MDRSGTPAAHAGEDRTDGVARAAHAVVTAAWALPILVVVALHATTRPSAGATLAAGCLAVAGLAALRLPDAALGGRRTSTRKGTRLVLETLGVPRFGVIVPDGALMQRAAKRGRTPRWLGNRASLARLRSRTFDAERTHWWWLLSGAAVVVWAFDIGAWHAGTMLAVLNVPLNVYPILLQRYTRARIDAIVRGRRHDDEET